VVKCIGLSRLRAPGDGLCSMELYWFTYAKTSIGLGSTQSLTEISTRDLPGVKVDFVGNVAVSTSYMLMRLHDLV
jgi:hypothetical protein